MGNGAQFEPSFVVKKKGLLASTAKYGNQAGEGVGYLKSWLWWTGQPSFQMICHLDLTDLVGMTMMIVGEILNFLA